MLSRFREILAPSPAVSPAKVSPRPVCDLCALALTKAFSSLFPASLVHPHSVTSELLNS
jgi:hypothetical protein